MRECLTFIWFFWSVLTVFQGKHEFIWGSQMFKNVENMRNKRTTTLNDTDLPEPITQLFRLVGCSPLLSCIGFPFLIPLSLTFVLVLCIRNTYTYTFYLPRGIRRFTCEKWPLHNNNDKTGTLLNLTRVQQTRNYFFIFKLFILHTTMVMLCLYVWRDIFQGFDALSSNVFLLYWPFWPSIGKRVKMYVSLRHLLEFCVNYGNIHPQRLYCVDQFQSRV